MTVGWKVGLGRLAMMATALTLIGLAPEAALAVTVNRPFSEARSFAGTETPAKAFEAPCGVAVDGPGDVYVADYFHDAIDIFGPGGTYLDQLKTSGADGPCGLAVDSNGRLFVNEYHGAVTRYTPNTFPPSTGTTYGAGTVLAPGPATGIALDRATGDLYIDERTAIVELDSTGAVVERIELGPLADAYGIAVSEFAATAGDVYVADAAAGVVDVFGPGGALAGTIVGTGTAQGRFRSLVDSSLAVDQTTGNLLVADNTQPGYETPAAVIDEFSSTGAYRGQVPKVIIDPEPVGLATRSDGGVYATSGTQDDGWAYEFGSAAPEVALSVAKAGSGEGAVFSRPYGIGCGRACVAEFVEATTVSLTAEPASGSVFAGWSGCPSASGPVCTVTTTLAQTVTVEFAPDPTPLRAQAGTVGREGSTVDPVGTTAGAALSVHVASAAGRAAVIEVALPEAGEVSIEGARIASVMRHLTPGRRRLLLRLDRPGARALMRSGKGGLRVPVRIVLRPDSGAAVRDSNLVVTFRRKERSRDR